ncbi:MAG: ATP-binding protein [Allomuricauda sp.]|uniref:ATP-binding protein n=2 Tax=Flavobacteriaceae TaxID=49546 RepID=UPI0030DBF5E8|tara:strand:- start:5897 stop:12349 length:6453 start_codon:yes stop_codon:yes gene_type:complete
MINNTSIPDADLSNAGDDYHILWAIQKSLDLLNFDKHGLKAVLIEGIEAPLSHRIDPSGGKLLGIDLIEYYSSDNFEKANRVIISQLKYSTRNANKNLTFYSLYKGKKAKSSQGSIIHRLANIYKAFRQNYGRDLVQKKIKIKLVSNRNFNPVQLSAIQEIQKELQLIGKKVSFNQLLKGNRKYIEAFQKLMDASGLKVTEFSDFIRLLDFEDCGSNSRDNLRKELIQAISNTSVVSRNQFNGLTRLILDKMMPESKTNIRITLTDVIATLGFNNGSLENLFPVPQNFEKLPKSVPREQLETILQEIEKNTGNPICVHGPAGIGKSTISMQIRNSIPDFCECIAFDCYGNGSYLDPTDRRHLHKNALVQLSNEIAKRVGVNFLVFKEDSEDVYIKEFKRRVLDAIEILKKRNENAYLVIIIDAADNSITAANKRNETSFIHDLLEEPFPPEFKLVVTTRTYRKESLLLPKNYLDILLKPFTEIESEQHLKHFFPKSSDDEARHFHDLTQGIPRVQSYSIGLKKEGVQEVINYLRPNGKTVEDLIDERILEAVNKIGNNGWVLVDHLFINLITLPRPVPVLYLAELLETDKDLIIDLASDIWHGLILSNGNLSFRDEDFENHIRKKYQANDQQITKIANLFLLRAVKEDYASINLGNLLFEAGLGNELKDIVLNEKLRKYPLDPIRNKEVYVERAKLAMKMTHRETDNLTFFKLLFIAAEQSKTDKALSDLLIENPDLVIQFGDEASLTKLNAVSDRKTWGGSFHLKLSGIYSREKSTIEIAKKHLKTANDWLDWRHKIRNDENLDRYPISSLDIAFETEAILRLLGPYKSYLSISRWKPKSVRYTAGNYFVDNVLLRSSSNQVKGWLTDLKLPILVQVFLINKLFKANFNTDSFNFKQIIEYLSKVISGKEKYNNSFYLLIIDFIEVLVFQNLFSKKEILAVLSKIVYSLPTRVPHFSSNNFDKSSELEMHLSLKAETLIQSINSREMTVEDIYPKKYIEAEKLKDPKKRRSLADEKREFKRFFKHAVPIYKLRADRLTSRLNEKDFTPKFELVCKNIKDDWDLRYYSHWANDQLNFLASIAIEVLMLNKFSDDQVDLILDSFSNKTSNRISIRLIALEKLINRRDKHTLCLKLLNEIDSFISESKISASETTELYIKCSIKGSKIDRETGKYYFDKAIEAVSDVDYEAFYQIRCVSELSEMGITQSNPQMSYRLAQFLEYADEKLSYYDKKHFPYGEGIKGIFNLDPASVFSTVCRWHHRDVISLNKYIPILLKATLENNIINHKVASSLLPLNSNYYHEDIMGLYRTTISRFNSDGDSENLKYFVKIVSRDLLLEQNLEHIKALYSELSNCKIIAKEYLNQLKEFIEFRTYSKRKKESKYSNNSSKEDYAHEINLDNIDLSSSKDLEIAIRNIVSRDNDYQQRWKIENFLSDIKANCVPQEYVGHLNALVDVSNEVLNYYSLEKALDERLKEWRIHPGVRKWSQEKFKYVLNKWFNKLNEDDYLFLAHVRSFSKIFSVSDDVLFDAIIHVIPDKIEQLTDESLYGLSLTINNHLTIEENENLIFWALERWTSKIEKEAGDGSWYDKLIPPSNPEQIVCDVLRFILGHPDKRLRWRAVHCIRRLINFGEIGIIKKLFEFQNHKECFPFQDKEYMFYWMSAKLYLWIAIERASQESPIKLVSLKNEIYQELLNQDLPHALIKFFIKKVCINLYKHDTSIFSPEEKINIDNSLISGLDMIKNDYGGKAELNSKISFSRERNFHFDPMDTLPYWYSGAARPFNLLENDVANIADYFITNKWGYTGNPNEDDYIRNQMSDRDYHLMSKRHGSDPVVEDLETYFEYHAMFCAVNQLLEFQPTVEPEYKDQWGTWDYWIKSKGNTWGNYWLSDIADTVPLEDKYWNNEFEKFDENWRSIIDDEKYDTEVGFDHFFDNNQIMAFSSVRRNFGENYESISIRSALVSNKGSEALLRAFQSAEDSYDYAIPFEKDEYDFEIDVNGFQYIGWLRNPSSDYEGLDVQDPFKKDIGRDYICFGKQIESIFDISYSEYHKEAFFENKVVSEYRQWNETTEYKYHDKVESSGVIFKVNIHFILNFLKEMNMCLILKCEIERQLNEKVYGLEKRDLGLANNTKIYLIRPDGKVKTLRGRNFKIG